MRSRKTTAHLKMMSDTAVRPRPTRFKKGKSGNPRGRPKGSRDIGNVLARRHQAENCRHRERQNTADACVGGHAAQTD